MMQAEPMPSFSDTQSVATQNQVSEEEQILQALSAEINSQIQSQKRAQGQELVKFIDLVVALLKQ